MIPRYWALACAAALLILTILLGAKFAFGQGVVIITPIPCDLTKNVLKKLDGIYREKAVGAGLTPGGDQMRLFLSSEGTVTMIITRPTGLTCIMGVGVDWQFYPGALNGDDT